MLNEYLNRLFFNKYKIKKFIAKTNWSQLYEGINIKDNESVAMKFEKKALKYNSLESEAYFLLNLKGLGIPKIISYGICGIYNVLVEELLGPSIYNLLQLKKNNKKELIKDICMISIQILDRLEYIHSKNVIHRDIKSDNFLIGRKDPYIVYLIDFGLAHKYRSSRTGKHIQFKKVNKIFGSYRFMSRYANSSYELSRRDDLESFGYMIIYLATNYLPWISTQNLKLKKKILIEAIYKLKNSATPEQLCKGLPEEFVEIIKYIRNLEFEQDPDYDYLKGLFISILSRMEQRNDSLFSWIITKKKRSKDMSEEKSYYIWKRRETSQIRLYNKIKKSFEKEINNKNISKNLSLDNKIINIYNCKSMNEDEIKSKYNNNINKENNIEVKALEIFDEKPDTYEIIKSKISNPINKISLNININKNISISLKDDNIKEKLKFKNKNTLYENKNEKNLNCQIFNKKINNNKILYTDISNNKTIKFINKYCYKPFNERKKLNKLYRFNSQNNNLNVLTSYNNQINNHRIKLNERFNNNFYKNVYYSFLIKNKINSISSDKLSNKNQK